MTFIFFCVTCLKQNVSLWKKVYLIYNFFFLRKIVVHIFTFVFYCVILPATVIFPEIEVPKWTTIYIPATITILNAIATPKSFYLILYWILFENVMAMHRSIGTLIGLLETSRVKEWIVTQKLGESNNLRENLIFPDHYSFPERFELFPRIDLSCEMANQSMIWFRICADFDGER